ncbi:response regulator [Methanococcoides sp. SA1]|nr:response regulator [Methanococcoides sp. SA1]
MAGSSLYRGTEHLPLVDDEEFFLRVTQRQLESQGYRVTLATDSKDALEKIRSHPEQFDLLITDQTMPGLTGLALSRAVKEIRNDLPVILCTGYSAELTKETSIKQQLQGFVSKPILGDALFQTVRSVLDA